MSLKHNSIWLEEKLLTGSKEALKEFHEILIIGSGFTGVSCAYWLLKNNFKSVAMIDYLPNQAASFRNCGHILNGTMESIVTLSALKGMEQALDIWKFSVDCCNQLQNTIIEESIQCDYKKDGYLVIATDQSENDEIINSVKILNHHNFSNQYIDAKTLSSWGFKNTFGARFEEGSAQAHPVKFRNSLLKICLNNGLNYHSNYKVENIIEEEQHTLIKSSQEDIKCTAVIIASNAYACQFLDFFKRSNFMIPFRGQILTSRPLKHNFHVKYPHSFNHGYEYSLVTEDNRLMIGGWRNEIKGQETGTFNLEPNPLIEKGLNEFVEKHYQISEDIIWDFSWTGIMASSRLGMPIIGPISNKVYCCTGYTGHGFSWSHGSSKLLVDIILGNKYHSAAKYFNPKNLLV